MRPVYIVTSGEYSDYGIDACFSTQAAAEAFCARSSRGGRVEVWALDDAPESRPNERLVRVILSENGDTKEVSDVTDADGRASWWQWQRSPDPSRFPHLGPQTITFGGTCRARDFEHAVKMARDVRAASIAAGDLDKLHRIESIGRTSVDAHTGGAC